MVAAGHHCEPIVENQTSLVIPFVVAPPITHMAFCATTLVWAYLGEKFAWAVDSIQYLPGIVVEVLDELEELELETLELAVDDVLWELELEMLELEILELVEVEELWELLEELE